VFRNFLHVLSQNVLDVLFMHLIQTAPKTSRLSEIQNTGNKFVSIRSKNRLLPAMKLPKIHKFTNWNVQLILKCKSSLLVAVSHWFYIALKWDTVCHISEGSKVNTLSCSYLYVSPVSQKLRWRATLRISKSFLL